MPELPEVETCKNGITPYLIHKKISSVQIRQSKLRWQVPDNLHEILVNQQILNITRRAKYIILHFHHGYLIIHLGMSGHLKIINDPSIALGKHDHVIFNIDSDISLRYHDPRKFGCILWVQENLNQYKLFKHLGPEPLEQHFNAEYLYKKSRNKNIAIKSLIMDQTVVVGIGNIYANEALFLSFIHPAMPSKLLSMHQCQNLVHYCKNVLINAIKQGGTTLSDFKNVLGKPGYFKQELHIYGKKNLPCIRCHTQIQHIKIGQRSSFFCPQCQTY